MPESVMDPRLETAMESLYRDVVALGDRARAWFDGPGLAWRKQLPLDQQAAVATESLAITARLLAVMAWLLDPAQGPGINAPLRPLVIDPDAEGPLPAVLHTEPGGEIALAARQLVERAEALALTPLSAPA
jgi:regulator of CtrA degradation